MLRATAVSAELSATPYVAPAFPWTLGGWIIGASLERMAVLFDLLVNILMSNSSLFV
jgi:hypothetical protein